MSCAYWSLALPAEEGRHFSRRVSTVLPSLSLHFLMHPVTRSESGRRERWCTDAEYMATFDEQSKRLGLLIADATNANSGVGVLGCGWICTVESRRGWGRGRDRAGGRERRVRGQDRGSRSVVDWICVHEETVLAPVASTESTGQRDHLIEGERGSRGGDSTQSGS